jgi:FMN phosphatase YigB (HAD superfamily)
MLKADGVVFMLDVDNTLLDNDRFAADLGDRLEQAFGAAERARYWAIFGRLREQLGLADYLGSLQGFLLEYPFAARLFPRALEAVAHLSTLGRPVVLSDGDIVFQPRKIQRSGIWDAVGGRVMIYLHKERVLDHVQQRYPANRYVMVDDKPNLLADMKSTLKENLTTVFVRQGHYALAPESNSVKPAPDMTIERIADLINLNLSAFQEPP